MKRKDRATKLLNYIADVTVNGHPETRGRPRPDPQVAAAGRRRSSPARRRTGTKQRLDRDGPEDFARWMRDEKRVLVTDTTMRDAHQSLLATRMRSYDIVAAAEAYAAALPQLLSLECWGGATFDVAMRFLTEDPWERLAALRERVPNILLQMLLRGANGVGYTNYPDNVVRFFVQEAAAAGVDLFRVFDCLNWAENMRVAMDAVLRGGKALRGGDLLHRRPARPEAPEIRPPLLCRAGARAGEGRRAYHRGEGHGGGDEARRGARAVHGAAARKSARRSISTRTTRPGLAAATVLAAIEAGVDAVDAAMDSLSGLTSQPCLGSLVAALDQTERATGLDLENIRRLSLYWEAVRFQYRRLRERPPRRRVGSLPARNAGRTVHQPEGAGARARPRKPLARGGARLCGGEPASSATS